MTTKLIVKDGHPTLRHEEREALGTVLQGQLIDLIDLALLGKHLHWNLTGPGSRSFTSISTCWSASGRSAPTRRPSARGRSGWPRTGRPGQSPRAASSPSSSLERFAPRR